jgi:hypothetical protein
MTSKRLVRIPEQTSETPATTSNGLPTIPPYGKGAKAN